MQKFYMVGNTHFDPVWLRTPSGDFALSLAPWEIKTLKNTNGVLSEVYMTED